MTADAQTSDASEEEVSGGNEKNQYKGRMKYDITHGNINDHLIELNSGAGAKENDTDKMEEDTPPWKKKSRESKKSKKDRKKKVNERSHSLEAESSP